MTRRSRLLLWGSLLLALPSAVWAEPREHRLANGLTVLIDADPGLVGVDVGVWYRTGPADEPAGRSGITHLMERLMFRGSPRFADGEYARQLTRRGASFNTFLSPDFSEFYSTGPAEALPTMLALEADRMAGQRLTAAHVAAAARAVADEQRRLEVSPVSKGLQHLYAVAFGSHPYAAPIQGRATDRARLTPAACAEYAKSRYAPGNAIVTVTGAVDPDTALALVTRAFGAVPRGEAAASREAALPGDGERRGAVATPVRMVMVGWRAPADSACGAELGLISQLLGAGASPQLASKLAADRLAMTATCAFDGRRRASLLYATALVAPNADTAAVERALIDQVERFAREPMSDPDFAAARKAMLLAARIERQGARGRAQALGVAALTDGNWRAADQRLARIERLTAADVQQAARAALDEAHRTVVWARPAPPARAPGAARSRPDPSKGGRP